ncbi:kinetochore-associated protein NSL1 homolog [Dendropsophus ebraccatus]|uniref:kinetochore-associated protein NSL1 homolog n=1 Tax=Dendropsophus ebraccatus TaxID=150705 RepID=UPI003831A2EB
MAANGDSVKRTSLRLQRRSNDHVKAASSGAKTPQSGRRSSGPRTRLSEGKREEPGSGGGSSVHRTQRRSKGQKAESPGNKSRGGAIASIGGSSGDTAEGQVPGSGAPGEKSQGKAMKTTRSQDGRPSRPEPKEEDRLSSSMLNQERSDVGKAGSSQGSKEKSQENVREVKDLSREVKASSSTSRATEVGKAEPSVERPIPDVEEASPSQVSSTASGETAGPSGVCSTASGETAGPSGVCSTANSETAGPSGVCSTAKSETAGPSGVCSTASGETAGPSGVCSTASGETAGPFSVCSAPSIKIAEPSGVCSTASGETAGPSGVCSATSSKTPGTSGVCSETVGPSGVCSAASDETAGPFSVCSAASVEIAGPSIQSAVRKDENTNASIISPSRRGLYIAKSPARKADRVTSDPAPVSASPRDSKVQCTSKTFFQEVLEMCKEFSKEILESQSYLNQEQRQQEHNNFIMNFETAFQDNVSIDGQSWHEAPDTPSEPDIEILEDKLDDAIVDVALKRKRHRKKILGQFVKTLKLERELLNQYKPVVKPKEFKLDSRSESRMTEQTATTAAISQQIKETMKALPAQLEKAEGFSQVLSLQPVLQESRIRQDILASKVVLQDIAKTMPKEVETTPSENAAAANVAPVRTVRKRQSPSVESKLYPLRSKRKISLEG